MFGWLFRRKERPIDVALTTDAIVETSALDIKALSIQERITRAIAARRLSDLATLGEEGMSALVLCLWAMSGDVAYSAATVLNDKVLASRATPQLAAAVDDPAQALQDAQALGVYEPAKSTDNQFGRVYKAALNVLGQRGDERGVRAVLRLCLVGNDYSRLAVKTLEQMLKRKRVYAHLEDGELEELAAMPDVRGETVGHEADRYQTTVIWPFTISCDAIRFLAKQEIQRRFGVNESGR